MAVGYATPFGVAGDLDALATAIGNKPNISDATEVIDVPEVTDLRFAIKVTGTDADDVKAAVESGVFKMDDNDATLGNYDVTVDGDTASIAYDDDAAGVVSALEALDTVDSGDVTVTGAGSTADPFVLTFDIDAELGDTVPVVTVADDDLNNGDPNITSPVANVRIVPGTTVS